MAEVSARTGWRLADALRRAAPTATRRQGVATYVRTDSDGTAWVRIAGADADTPVTGAVLSECEPGQVVEYRIDGGECSIVGNASVPSVGAAHVADVVGAVIAPVRIATATARDIADAAKRVAEAVNQHFWTDTNGIHVTNATQEDWETSQSGPNVLINSVGQLFRDGLNNLVAITTEQGARAISFFDGAGNAAANVLAVIGADGITLGRSTESHAYVDYHSLQLVDKDDNVYFHVSDLRNSSGYAEIRDSLTEELPPVGSLYDLAYPWFSDLSVTYRGNVLVLGTEYRVVETSTIKVIADLSPYDQQQGDNDENEELLNGLVAHYRTTSPMAKAYTVGTRDNGEVSGPQSYAEGSSVASTGYVSHAEGYMTNAHAKAAHSEGSETTAAGKSSHAEGSLTTAAGTNSHAEGCLSSVLSDGYHAHAEGWQTEASGIASHVEGYNSSSTTAGNYSHAEGEHCTTSAIAAHAEGYNTTSSGPHAHSEGYETAASGTNSHAEGQWSTASGEQAHAQNEGTLAAYDNQTAIGKFNDNRQGNAFEIGNGTSDTARSNAFTVDWTGNVDAAGRITQAVDSTTATVGTAAASIGTNSVRRCGNIVTVTLANIQLASAISNNGYSGTIATVPAGYRPASNAYGACYAAGANLGGSYARITTAGIVAIRNQSGSSIAASTTVLPALSITYIID